MYVGYPSLLCYLCAQREMTASIPANKKYKNVMGTDGDLRKLKLSKAKSLLRNFGVSEEDVSYKYHIIL